MPYEPAVSVRHKAKRPLQIDYFINKRVKNQVRALHCTFQILRESIRGVGVALSKGGSLPYLSSDGIVFSDKHHIRDNSNDDGVFALTELLHKFPMWCCIGYSELLVADRHPPDSSLPSPTSRYERNCFPKFVWLWLFYEIDTNGN